MKASSHMSMLSCLDLLPHSHTHTHTHGETTFYVLARLLDIRARASPGLISAGLTSLAILLPFFVPVDVRKK
jgi:hypothetical protein